MDMGDILPFKPKPSNAEIDHEIETTELAEMADQELQALDDERVWDGLTARDLDWGHDVE
jgi:hypothetical protein